MARSIGSRLQGLKFEVSRPQSATGGRNHCFHLAPFEGDLIPLRDVATIARKTEGFPEIQEPQLFQS